VGFTAFSADGQRIAVARIQTGTVTVFDTATGRRVSVLRAPTGIIIAPTFSPDGRTLAAVIVAGATGSVDFFDVATGHRRARLALRLPPASVVYGRNGTRIATITTRRLPTLSDPGTSSLMLWDTASLQPVGDELFFPGAVGPRIAPSPDGRRLVNSGDGSALMWDIDPSHWAAMACRIANRVLTRAEWERYVPHRAYHSGC